MTSLQLMVASEKIVGCGSNEPVTLRYVVPYPSANVCSMQTQVSENFLISAAYQDLH
jgi:hypothetical protein